MSAKPLTAFLHRLLLVLLGALKDLISRFSLFPKNFKYRLSFKWIRFRLIVRIIIKLFIHRFQTFLNGFVLLPKDIRIECTSSLHCKRWKVIPCYCWQWFLLLFQNLRFLLYFFIYRRMFLNNWFLHFNGLNNLFFLLDFFNFFN